ncbi:SRPBCC family protein [Ruania suaedae]|uniref:type II toxin-antitoxin system RatA family toxin n=1 Tax=Ruania suaedae TaxID=2897774 RepID=UPI001E573BA5|nr:SRPBCC family protein [Ruania suaedae]UFU03314.1 SRPBCC family protein [Ruania suaedae]
MPIVQAQAEVPVPAATAFAVSQTTGAARLRWDPFIRRQWFLDGAPEPGKGVRTATVHRSGLRMVSEYVSYAPPRNVGMRMVTGPWFFEMLAGGWRFEDMGEGRTLATWKYSFRCRPRWLAPVAERVGAWVLGRDVRRRLAGFAAGCEDPQVLDAL